jgi:ribosome-binding protein aMBF1 (putative translation factor)
MCGRANCSGKECRGFPQRPRDAQQAGRAPRAAVRRARLGDVDDFPADRYVRAARRAADLSQRELAARAGLPHHVVGNVERTPSLARVSDVAKLLNAAGFTLQIVDADGQVFDPEPEQKTKLRDRGRRRFPAHLDVRSTNEGWWGDGWPMFMGKAPTHTFDRSRDVRDWRRQRRQRPEDEGAN